MLGASHPVSPTDMTREVTIGPATGRIETIGVVTRNRPAAAVGAVASYVEHTRRSGRTPEVLICDDSDAAERDILRAELRQYARHAGTRLSYAGRDEKLVFAERLAQMSGVPRRIVDFALFDVERAGVAPGANRNALLLGTAGGLVLSVDDDTICRTSPPPYAQPGIGYMEGRDPSEFWFFGDHQSALAAARAEHHDLLAAHEGLLGRVYEAPAGQAGDTAGGARDRGTIAVTFNGLLGDCGWGAPFGWWGGPVGYLLLEGPSHERLVRSAPHYLAACTSRQLLRVAPRPTVTDATFWMTTFVGLDNRTVLPPFMPVRRGEDAGFGALLRRCFSEARCGHVPWALLHAPAHPRRFSPMESVRSASGFDMAKLFLACVHSIDAGTIGSASDRLRSLGTRLVDLGAQPAREFRAWVREAADAVNQGCLARLEARLDGATAPLFWINDVRRFLNVLRSTMHRDDYDVPLDLRQGRDEPAARELAQRVILRFGELLEAWPTLMSAAERLRHGGEPLCREVLHE
jgi:hypothetical protein